MDDVKIVKHHPIRTTILGILGTLLLAAGIIWYQENH